jgi:heterotetrameric sarcosine oxidase gamma subunit
VDEPEVTVTVAAAGDVIALDLWDDGDAPALSADIALLRVEPRRWWLLGAGAHDAELAAAVGDRGAWAPIGGGLVRATLTGPGWRALLMVAGLFDAEDPGFGPGSVASTVIHHVPVRIAVASETACDVYCAASYAPALIELWSDTIGTSRVSVSPSLFATTIGTA